jgi:hypothetical protein
MDTNLVSIDIADTTEYTSIPISPRTNSFDTGIDSHSSEINDVPVKINIIVDNGADSQPIISNVEEELGLTEYTDNHFTSITNKDLERVRNSYTAPLTVPEENLIAYKSSSNSPVLSVLDSNRGSRSNSDEEPETNISRNNTDISYRTYHKRHYNKLNYRDVERSIGKYYKQQQSNALHSNEMDILTTFVKGQKHLYIQSKLLTQQKLNCLVFPAIIISAVITIISPFVECKSWNVGIISGLNAIVTLFISLMNLLKYESSTEMYSLLASLFDNIETSIELTGRKLTIMQQQDADTSQVVLSKFNDVETRISDYKLTNAVLIPEEIKTLFPIISHINIFSFIKKTDLHRKMLIEKLRDIKNEIYFILYKWEKEEKYAQKHNLAFPVPLSPAVRANSQRERERDRLTYLYILKDTTKNEIIEFQNTYSVMDTIFNREISGAERNQNKWWGYLLCYFFKTHTPSYDYLDGINPILAEYFSNVINEFTVHKLAIR